MSNKPIIKNREFAEIQITAEQLIREARDNQTPSYTRPKMTIHDEEELQAYRLTKRKEFEQGVTKERQNPKRWTRYAFWEEEQGEYVRARSIFERALEQDYTIADTWMKYVDFELRNNQVNKARNILERATSLLPMVYKLWFKYVRLEETVENFDHCKEVFEKWMTFKPGEYPWLAYIKFEIRIGEIKVAKELFEQANQQLHCEEIYKEWVEFEKRFGTVESTRELFNKMAKDIEVCQNSYYQMFAEFELSQGEIERARQIYLFGIDHSKEENKRILLNNYVKFEKINGEMKDVDNAIWKKRRFEYEQKIQENPFDYDTWYDYIQMEMNEIQSEETTTMLYERIISQTPQEITKEKWTRYIEFWVLYARYEEKLQHYENAFDIFSRTIKIIPHKYFTFKKVWRAYANYARRRKNIPLVRKIYGAAIGWCHKDDIFKDYIEFETENGEQERIHKIQAKWNEFKPKEIKQEEVNNE
ncbi:crooked neck protein putative [Entamoeba histolytica]|uniref:Crooked neck protein putative n=1 Tax=Entamoeba histolytica TaxID=5759 RepID=A0A175JQX4_ENTHI|nr:crooked neck protein putative [Entamoeba histolytica]